ncbi:hypothetical protein H6G81_32345 [Scytonema hofmannii FACHB-248]|uniref:Uncharacterized protein n=1 Tax=Scytonema hofmannii FACHB-248 TaxID=1842502 RepID=A0ABR8H0X1_9CYAN|nr:MULTISPECIES: hypothetical protein [Nostocales]MBD2609083.1 hypothetical protein [Scytonema hofmannii FACHB-248]
MKAGRNISAIAVNRDWGFRLIIFGVQLPQNRHQKFYPHQAAFDPNTHRHQLSAKSPSYVTETMVCDRRPNGT